MSFPTVIPTVSSSVSLFISIDVTLPTVYPFMSTGLDLKRPSILSYLPKYSLVEVNRSCPFIKL